MKKAPDKGQLLLLRILVITSDEVIVHTDVMNKGIDSLSFTCITKEASNKLSCLLGLITLNLAHSTAIAKCATQNEGICEEITMTIAKRLL